MPPASSPPAVATWWEGRTFLDQEDLQEGAGPAHPWGPISRAEWEQTQSMVGAKALAHPWMCGCHMREPPWYGEID